MQQTTRSHPNRPDPRTNELVERAARQAIRDEKPKPDLLKDGFPFSPGLWNIVVEPLEPRKMSDGGIEVVDLSQQAEGFQMTIGRVLKAGPQSMHGKTSSGIDLSNFLEGVTTREQLIGLFVIYQLHTGQTMTLRRTGQKIIVMKVTDLLGVTEEPDAWKFYI